MRVVQKLMGNTFYFLSSFKFLNNGCLWVHYFHTQENDERLKYTILDRKNNKSE